MNRNTRILMVEDLASDALLIERELRQAAIKFASERVETKEAFLKRLAEFQPDIVLSDFSLPQFSGLEALRLLKERQHDVPFILITGSLTEEVAVECMKEGVHDYILKTSLKRLPSAVINALKKTRVEREKLEAETALQRSDELYRLIAENTGDLICLLDTEARFLYVSPSYQEVLGYSPADLLDRSVFSLIHPDDRKAAEQKCTESLADKKPERLEFRFKHSDGSWKIFEALGNWICDSSGHPQRGILVSRDITERKEAEDTLRESEERTRLILENALDAVVTINAEGLITGWNPQAEATFGWSDQEASGRPLSSLIIPKEHRQALERGLKHFLATGEGRVLNKRIEITALRRDGTEFPVELSVSPMRSRDTFIFSAFIRDISERKLAEEKLRLSEEQLRMSQKLEAVGQLAGGVAHDFNNILTVITGYSDILMKKTAENDPNRGKIEEIKRAAERASSLTHQLLAFSRKQVLQPKLFKLNSLVADIGKMLQRLIGEDIELAMVLTEDSAEINADPGQIEQVLMNLVVNARDAMPNGGKVTIETANVEIDRAYAEMHIAVQPGSYAMLAVSDNGSGMDHETQKHIFEPFYTTKDQGKGTGLGLSTVYGIVNQSGGNIWVYSEVGQGTIFKIYLPRVVCKTSAPQADLQADKPLVSGGTETILLVEDEPQIRRMTFEFLTESGYEVLVAANGIEALKILEEKSAPVHLILTDVIMPGMNGRELAERVTVLRPGTKVLYMSGYTNDAIVRHGVLDSGTWFIQKPFSPDALGSTVREVLDSKPGMELMASVSHTPSQ
jgi:two-component system, cell cycle sensor histidine kinase and response regulator CckA